VGYEELSSTGQCFVWFEPPVIDRLTAMRQTGESYSDVILRLVEMEARQRLSDMGSNAWSSR
jgi:predicted CopG family antitoxin